MRAIRDHHGVCRTLPVNLSNPSVILNEVKNLFVLPLAKRSVGSVKRPPQRFAFLSGLITVIVNRLIHSVFMDIPRRKIERGILGKCLMFNTLAITGPYGKECDD